MCAVTILIEFLLNLGRNVVYTAYSSLAMLRENGGMGEYTTCTEIGPTFSVV